VKTSYCVGLVVVVFGALQGAACSSQFKSCADSRNCEPGDAGGSAGDGQGGGGGSNTLSAGSAGAAASGGADGGAPDAGSADGGAADAAGAGGEGGQTDGAALGTLNQPCSVEGAYACAGHAQKGQLICSGGKWAPNGTCEAGSNCDSTPGNNAGSCAPILAQCSASSLSTCSNGSAVACGPDLVSTTTTACAGSTPVCLSGACVACTPTSEQCSDASHTQTCSPSGAWEDPTLCSGGYCNGAGVCGVCQAGAKQCIGNGPQTCSPSGVWSTVAACAGTTPVCNASTITCTPRPSCTGLAATCGPSNNSDCCGSSVVPGGSFYRSYDGVTANYTSTAYPATVSNFRLDENEITVGRFRKFVAAYTQNMTPAGAGKNPNDASDTGWATAWNAQLETNATTLSTAVACGGGTWTPAAGDLATESRPMNCLDWFEAEAFCIWDGGRLPTEAEWNYAAAGGSEQRIYPWGSSTPGANASLAVYGCYYNGTGTCSGVASIAIVGTITAGEGKWGQADLGGNVLEWVADWYGAYPVPCTNCSAPSGAIPYRVHRGGSFSQDASTLLSSVRDADAPAVHYLTYGARCARLP
jgi:sulfatase modifying factor 1